MKPNYLFGLVLAIIFPGLIQLYTGEKGKAGKYMFLYFASFFIVLIYLTATGHLVDVDNINSVGKDPILINASILINLLSRLLSGADGLLKIREYHRLY